jgi:cytochrome c biogenesis protein CcmG, thiol:disulfide interchange protein DsbE
MRRLALPGLITLIAVALLALLAFGVANDGTSSSIDGEVASRHFPLAPSAHMALPVLGSADQKESLAGLRGHLVMVEFFAGWCDGCQADAPDVERAEHMLQKSGGTVLGVSFQDSSSDSASYMRQYHLTFPAVRDASQSLANAFGVDGVPETFIINPQGRIIALRRYQLTQSWVTHTLNKILAPTA